MSLLYYHVFFLVFFFDFNAEVLANILGKGKDVCGGEGVVIVQPKEECKNGDGKLKKGPLLEPVGDLCHKKEVIVKPAQCAKSAFAKKEDIKPFSFPDFPVDINAALPVPLYPPPVSCDPSRNPACPPQFILVLPPPPMLPMFPPENLPQAPPFQAPPLLNPPPPPAPPPLPLPPPEVPPVQVSLPPFQLPPVQTQIPSPIPPPSASDIPNYHLPRCPSCASQPAPCPACMAKAQNIHQISPVAPEPSLQSLPRCSSCSGAATPCTSCAAKLEASALPLNTLQTSPNQLQSEMPRCSSCAASPSPCSSCASKMQPNLGDSSLTEYSYYPVPYPDNNFIPADAVSQQLAYRAKQEEKIKIEGQIAYGFKTLPIEIDHFMPSKERYPEEALFQFNGQVLEFLPEKLILSKAFDPYKGSEVLVAAKVPTHTKKLSLSEIGFGPVIVEPSPYIKKD